MSRDIPDELKIIKNSLSQESPWLILVEITLTDAFSTVLYLVRNIENIVYKGNEYIAMPFELGMNKITNSSEIPFLTVKVSNVSLYLQKYLNDLSGLVGSICKIIIVSEDNLDSDYSELEQEWNITESEVTQEFVTFKLSLPNLLLMRFPLTRFISMHCRFTFREIECNYTGELETCRRTLQDCKIRNNTKRFGGTPGLNASGIRVVY